MTVCIAAICNLAPDAAPCVVTASDRMITLGGLQYEPNQRKALAFGTSTIAMFAGDMQLHAAVAPLARERIKKLLEGRNPQMLTVKEIADSYAIEFAYYRRSLAEREILVPRGLDFERFARQQSVLPHYQVREIDALIAAHSIDSTAVIAGLDHTGAHIYKVRDPGVADSCDTTCFAAAGSGKDIAEAQFMVAQYDKQWRLPNALWLAFSAKARAQVVGGVGPKTDLIVITLNKIHYASDAEINTLFGMFGRVLRKERQYNAEAVGKLEAIIGAAAAADAQKDAAQSAPVTETQPAEPPKPDNDAGDSDLGEVEARSTSS